MCSTSKCVLHLVLEGICFKSLAMQSDVNKEQTAFKCEFKQQLQSERYKQKVQ